MHRIAFYLISLVPAGLIFATFLGWHYHFFPPLNLIVSICAALLVLVALEEKSYLWLWIMIVILVVFNPFFAPVHVHRHLWRTVEFFAGVAFIGAALTHRSN